MDALQMVLLFDYYGDLKICQGKVLDKRSRM